MRLGNLIKEKLNYLIRSFILRHVYGEMLALQGCLNAAQELAIANSKLIKQLQNDNNGQRIDYSDLADEINYNTLAENVVDSIKIDYSDLADEINYNTLAGQFSSSDIANEIDLCDLANDLDLNDIAENVVDSIEIDYKKLCQTLLYRLNIRPPAKEEQPRTTV